MKKVLLFLDVDVRDLVAMSAVLIVSPIWGISLLQSSKLAGLALFGLTAICIAILGLICLRRMRDVDVSLLTSENVCCCFHAKLMEYSGNQRNPYPRPVPGNLILTNLRVCFSSTDNSRFTCFDLKGVISIEYSSKALGMGGWIQLRSEERTELFWVHYPKWIYEKLVSGRSLRISDSNDQTPAER